MRKLILTSFVALVSLCSYAQKGEKAVGINLSYGTKISNIGVGVKGQYNITDAIRAEASFDYFLKKDDTKMWDINVNAHYLFPIANKVKVYPLVGVTYTNWTVTYMDYDSSYPKEYASKLDLPDNDSSSSTGKFGVNLGGGASYDITNNLVLNAEIKYQLISDFNQAVFGVGVAYKF